MSAPAFSVVLKAYDEEEWIAGAIRSVLAQTREDFELIVVDDGSCDGTAEVVRGFGADSRVRLLSQDNQGVSAAVNTGIAAGTAPYIALIDADDLWMPTYLEQMGKALDADPQAGFAYTSAWILEHPSGRFRRQTSDEATPEPKPPPRDPERFLRLLIEVNFVFGLAMFRRSAIERVGGGFNRSLAAAEEYEVWIRMLAAGYSAARGPDLLVVVRDRGGSLHTDEHKMIESVREVCRIAGEDLDTSAEVKRLARRRMEALDRDLAALTGAARLRSAKGALRRKLGGARRAMLGRRRYRETPKEVAAAFPRLSGRGADQGPSETSISR